MRILFIADGTLEDPASGSEQVLSQQATSLAREGMSVYALTRQTGSGICPAKILPSGVTVVAYGLSIGNLFAVLPSLYRNPHKLYDNLIQEGPFDAAISHQPMTQFALLCRRKLRNTPLVYVFHSPWHEEYVLMHKGALSLRHWLAVKMRQRIEKFCLKRADKVMVLSHFMKEKVTDIHGISSDRIVVNPGGVDLDRFSPHTNRKLLKGELEFPEGKIHLLTLRNLEPRMGLDNLLKCIHILKKGQANIHLLLAGEGIERQRLENQVRQYGLEHAVTMAGFIPSNKLPQYYGAADFFILPTRDLEGFGLVTVESMACGTPVLGTPVGATKEILSGFDSRFLFEDASPRAMAAGIRMAVGEYGGQNEKYGQLRVRCREYAAQRYGWKRHTDQLISILQEIIQTNPWASKTMPTRGIQTPTH